LCPGTGTGWVCNRGIEARQLLWGQWAAVHIADLGRDRLQSGGAALCGNSGAEHLVIGVNRMSPGHSGKWMRQGSTAREEVGHQTRPTTALVAAAPIRANSPSSVGCRNEPAAEDPDTTQLPVGLVNLCDEVSVPCEA